MTVLDVVFELFYLALMVVGGAAAFALASLIAFNQAPAFCLIFLAVAALVVVAFTVYAVFEIRAAVVNK